MMVCSLTYVTTDDSILNAGKDQYQKCLPSHPADRHLLGMRRRDQIYISLWSPICTETIQYPCQSFSMDCSECRCFLPHSLFGWLPYNGTAILHIVPMQHKHICILCANWVPLATAKLEGPSTSLSFLGIILDTNHMEIRLPPDKLARIQELLKTWLPRKKTEAGSITSRCHKSCATQ